MRSLRATALLIALVVSSGCMSPPPAFDQEREFFTSLKGEALPYSVALAPLRTRYPVSDFPEENTKGREDPNSLQPPLSSEQSSQLESKLEEAIGKVFGQGQVQVLAQTAEGNQKLNDQALITKDCQRAENIKAQLLIVTELEENKITNKGPELLTSFIEFVGFCFFPFHMVIPNERFEVTRRLKVRVFDVRNPDQEVFSTTVNGADARILSELEHGLVFVNTYRWLFGFQELGERYDGDQWKGVYNELSPHTDRELQKNLMTELDRGLRSALQSPAVQRNLTLGDPSKARLYGVLIGQDVADGPEYASADARALREQLSQRQGRPQLELLSTPASKVKVLQSLSKLRTKAVDRVLFYFAGQGFQNAQGQQALLLANGQKLWLREVRDALKEVAARNVLFLLDCSFGGRPYRARGKGRRTANESAESSAEASYLKPLIDLKRGWQVVAAAEHNQATGEYRSHGLLTGLLLTQLQDNTPLDLSKLGAVLGRRLESRSEALFGRPHQLFARPLNGQKAFVLEPTVTPKTKPDKS